MNRILLCLMLLVCFGAGSARGQTIELQGGTITILGSGLDEVITIEQRTFYFPWPMPYFVATIGSAGKILVERSYFVRGVSGIFAWGGAGFDTITNATGLPSTLDGGPGNDILQGGSGPDTLAGQTGNDFLFGGAGDDLLSGFLGADVLQGQEGRDTFLYYWQDWIFDPPFAPSDPRDVAHWGWQLDLSTPTPGRFVE